MSSTSNEVYTPFSRVAWAIVAIASSWTLGCASEQVVWRRYPSMTIAELSLPEKAALRIVASDDPDTSSFAARLRDALRGSGLAVVGDANPASHIVLIQGGTAFRRDTPDEANYTGRVGVETIASDAGSFQRVKRERAATHSAVRELSLAVYAAKTLTPVHYLTIPIYEGGVDEGGALDARDAANENRRHQAQFAKLAVARLEEIFAVRQRSIGVPVPIEANGDLKVKFLKIESAIGAEDEDELRKTLGEIDTLASNPAIIPGPLEEFAEASAADGWKPPEGSSREAILGNYYLVALRREIGCVDPEALSAIHAEHLRILELSEDPSLRMACPIALGRLEEKLSRLRAH